MKPEIDKNSNAHLKVWWIPQVPGSLFEVEVSSVEEGVKLMSILARYDLFQFEHGIKPDYSNVGGLLMLEDGEWVDWCDYETEEDDPERWLESRAAKKR